MKSKWTWKDIVVLTIILGATVFILRKPSSHSSIPDAATPAVDLAVSGVPSSATDLPRSLTETELPITVIGGPQGETVTSYGQLHPPAAAGICPVCAAEIRAGSPTAVYYGTRGETVCSHLCLEKRLEPCVICGRRVTFDEGFRTLRGSASDSEWIFTCMACSEKPFCDVCYETTGVRPNRRELGRRLPWQNCYAPKSPHRYCAAHMPVYIDTLDSALPIVREVRARMVALGVGTTNEVEFQLVTGKINGVHAGDHKISFVEENGERRISENRVRAMTGQKLPDFIHTVAHEYGHEWHSASFQGTVDRLTQEGIAEVIAAIVNESYGRASMNAAISKKAYPYGPGYDQVRRETGGTADGLRRYLLEKATVAAR